MANEIRQKALTAIILADTTDYVDNNGFGARTDQIDLTSIAVGAARQSAKVSLAAGEKGTRFAVYAAIEFITAPIAGEVVDFWIGFSPSSTAGTGNPGGLSGADSAYTGTTGGTLDESLKQLEFLGSLVCTPDATTEVQMQFIGWFVAAEENFMLVVDNNTSDIFEDDAVEMAIRIVPYVDEVQ